MNQASLNDLSKILLLVIACLVSFSITSHAVIFLYCMETQSVVSLVA